MTKFCYEALSAACMSKVSGLPVFSCAGKKKEKNLLCNVCHSGALQSLLKAEAYSDIPPNAFNRARVSGHARVCTGRQICWECTGTLSGLGDKWKVIAGCHRLQMKLDMLMSKNNNNNNRGKDEFFFLLFSVLYIPPKQVKP